MTMVTPLENLSITHRTLVAMRILGYKIVVGRSRKIITFTTLVVTIGGGSTCRESAISLGGSTVPVALKTESFVDMFHFFQENLVGRSRFDIQLDITIPLADDCIEFFT